MPELEKLRRALQQEALRLLVRREHSRQELQQKLLQKLRAFPEAQSLESDILDGIIQITLDAIREKRWQSDERFAQQRVTHRSGRYGNQRLKQELSQRGISADVISEALENGEDEVVRCRQVWLKKFGGPAENHEGMAKQVRFLQYRGFSGATIRQVLKSLPDELITEES